MGLTRVFKSIASAVAAGGAILVLCACAGQGTPTEAATGAQFSTGTALPTEAAALPPTYEISPGSIPSATTTREPPTRIATVSDRGSSDATSQSTADRRLSEVDLEIQAPESVQVIPGETAVFTLSIHNLGPGPATGVVLTDVLPAGTVPLWTRPAQPLCGRQKRDVRCDVGDLQAGDAITVTLDLSVGGTEAFIAGTQPAGAIVDLSASTCVIDLEPTQPQIRCRLKNLQRGGSAQVIIGVGVDAQTMPLSSQALVHTAIVVANEDDTNLSNNRTMSPVTVGTAGPVTATAVPTATNLVVHADGPSTVTAGQPFTYTYTISNSGALDATNVTFEDALPSDLSLITFAPGRPLCEQWDNTLTCYLHDPSNSGTVTFTLVISGFAEQPMLMELDPLMPGWPICYVVEERTYLHVIHCALGVLKPGQATHVQLVLAPIGVQERMTANTASVMANEAELQPRDNSITTTMTIQVRADLSVRSKIGRAAIAGETLSYTLSVANLGPSDADGVVLTDALPEGTVLLSADASQGDGCQVKSDIPSTGTVTCGLGRLSGGETAKVTFVLKVDESLPLPVAEGISHSASVVAEQVDADPSNNELTESIPVSSGDKD